MVLENIIKRKRNYEEEEKIDISKIKRKNKDEIVFYILNQKGLTDKFKRNPRTRIEIPYTINELIDGIDFEKVSKENFVNLFNSKIANHMKIENDRLTLIFEPIITIGTDENELIYESIEYKINMETNEISIINNTNRITGNALDLSIKLNSKKEIKNYDRYGIEISRKICNLERNIDNISYNDITWYNGKVKPFVNDVIWKEYQDKEYDFITNLEREDVICININTNGKHYTYPKHRKIFIINSNNISELDYIPNDKSIIDYDNWSNPIDVQQDIKTRTKNILINNIENNIDAPYFKGIINLAKKYGYDINPLLKNKD